MDKNQFPDGLESEVGEKGDKLSGGQRQRVAIARALVKKPKILIMDESTASLDAEAEKDITIAVDKIIEKHTITVIIIAHRLSTIKYADKIFMIEHGEIVEAGTHEELLMNNGPY